MLIFDNLGSMVTEIDENEIPNCEIFNLKMLDNILYQSHVIIKDQYFYTQLCQTDIGIFLTRISLIDSFVPNNVSFYCLLKLLSLECISFEAASDIILVSLLENKQIIKSLYKEMNTYVRGNVH